MATIEQHYSFLKRWYKHSRFEGRNGNHYPDDYSWRITRSAHEYLEKYGHCFISRHESNTGQPIKYDSDLKILGEDAPPIEYQSKTAKLSHIFGK